MTRTGVVVLRWLDCPLSRHAVHAAQRVVQEETALELWATIDGMRDDDGALTRAVVLVCCALLRCVQRYGGSAQAGDPCNSGWPLRHALGHHTVIYYLHIPAGLL